MTPDEPAYKIPNLCPRSRLSMIYRVISKEEKRNLSSMFRDMLRNDPDIPRWKARAVMRRVVFLILVLVPVLYAYRSMITVLSDRGVSFLEGLIIFDFSVLFAWLALNFWTGAFGFLTLLLGGDSLNPSRILRAKTIEVPSHVRTAVVIPVCNEDVDAVFSGLRAIYESVHRTGRLGHFDFLVLSDTSDPDIWVREEVRWAETCQKLNAHGRLLYRHRKSRVGRKSGNIADFCRRWGRDYKYMVILDSDSIMDGSVMVKLMQIMEARPDIGILQTSPKGINSRNLLSRIQQFSSHVYGSIYAAGSHFWQLGDMSFWGHNAIVRLEPFIKYCALPKSRGKPPFGGMVLSHDFVEAALMRRAGWGVWLAYDLEGSYEQLPAVLPEELRRDRRWCEGNIQHIRFIGMKGISFGHRLLFLNGNMFYFSSFFWLLLIILTCTQGIRAALHHIEFFPAQRLLFPVWPVQYQGLSMRLLALTAFFLFSSKLFGIFIVSLKRRRLSAYGGPVVLSISLLAETVSSVLLAPIKMMSHSSYVLKSLLGRRAGWGSQRRGMASISFKEALKTHAFETAAALVCSVVVYSYNEAVFWWLSVIFFPLMLSIPLSLAASSAALGAWFQRMRIFLIPEETAPPRELADYLAYLALSAPSKHGFALAVTDPQVNALHCAFQRKDRRLKASIERQRGDLEKKVRAHGPAALTLLEQKYLLCDPARLRRLLNK